MIYYIADMHFGHTNVLRFDNRPFPDTAQMDDTLIQNWNGRVTSDDTVYVLGDAFWKNEENSIRIMERLQGQKHLIQGNHDRVKGKLRPYWESIEQYAEVNDENRLVILSHYPILFYKNQHYGAVMLYGHVHNTREWKLVEKWKNEQWAMGIPSRLINVGCMRVRKTSVNFMQPSAAHGTAFRRSPALCKASGFMIETVQSRRTVGMRIVDTIAGTQRTP